MSLFPAASFSIAMIKIDIPQLNFLANKEMLRSKDLS